MESLEYDIVFREPGGSASAAVFVADCCTQARSWNFPGSQCAILEKDECHPNCGSLFSVDPGYIHSIFYPIGFWTKQSLCRG
jgi:hypothetical protein